MITPPKRTWTTGSGRVLLSQEQWDNYRTTVYEYYFVNNRKWTFEGQSVYWQGELIHYSDFMKAKRGSL